MDKKWKKRWIAALESKKYRQTRSKLHSSKFSNGMCCLGVLCDLVDPEGWKWDSSEEEAPKLVLHRGTENFPHSKILKETGVNDSSAKSLARLNDEAHYSFKKIANWIRVNL